MGGSEDGGKRRDRDRQGHYRRATLAHPLRQRIVRLMDDGREAGRGEIAAALEQTHSRIGYHLRVLVRHRVLKVVPKAGPREPLYRRSPRAHWVRKMLGGRGE